MKGYFQKLILFAVFTVIAGTTLQAQYDDVYYDPDSDTETYYQSSNNDRYQNDYDDYDDSSYEYGNDYDYYYSSRIRRFNRAYRGFDFYDPCYVDSYYYNPYYGAGWSPGSSIYIGLGNGYSSYRRYRRALRWNRYRYGFNPISSYYASNFWCPPSYSYFNGFNSYYRPGGFFNNYGYGGYNNSFYYNNYVFCPTPVYNTNNVTVINENNNGRGSVYGPRSTGTVKTSPRGVVKGSGLAAPKGQRSDAVAGNAAKGDFLKDRATVTSNKPNRGTTGSVAKSDRGNVVKSDRPVSTRPTYNNPSKGTSKGPVATRPSKKDVARSDRGSSRPVYKPSSRDTYRPPSSYKPSGSSRGSSAATRGDRPSTYRPSGNSRRPSSPSASRSGNSRTNRPSAPAYRPSSSSRSSSATRGSSSRGSSSRGYSPSSRGSSSRGYTPSRSSSSSRSSAGRSSSPSRSSASPSRSSSSSRSSASRSRSSSPRSSGSSSRSSSPRRGN